MKRQITLTLLPIGLVIFFLTFSHMTIAAPGDLDPTFGNGGKVIDWSGSIHSVAIQQDGKIVTIGDTGYSIVIARYNQDGSPDTTFGSGGKVAMGFPLINPNASIAIQPDGKIVVAQGLDDDTEGDEFDVLLRFNPNGSLDSTFGAAGIVRLPWHIAFSSIAVQPDGKIVVVGAGCTVVRYNQDGSSDTTFDGDGIATTTLGGSYDWAFSVAIQTDGKIVAAGRGRTTDTASVYDFAVVRYNSDGSLDSTFDGDGIVTTNFGLYDQAHSEAFSISLQWDGKIVAAGHSYNGSNYDWAVVRYNPDGSLDNTFDSDGKVITPISSIYDSGSNVVAVQNDGRIVVSGTSYGDFTLVRYNTNGSLDATFGGGDGIKTVDFNNSNDVANGMALDGQGRAVVVGDADGAFALARFLLAPRSAPFDYDGDGKSDVSVFRHSTNEWHIMQSSGGIRVQGWGLAGDKMAPADFDGDGKTDIAVFRPAEGNWYVILSSNNTVTVAGWGLATDKLVPGDYNGDGKADFVVFRESEGRWYRRDTDGQVHFQDWGLPGDKPAPADFDGDGRLDLTVFRPSEGRWYTIRSSDAGITATDWGVSGDIPVAADYSGDGKADFVVFRPSDLTWYRRNTDDGSLHFITWGLAGDIPAPGDYDGDGKTDLAVYRPSNGTWYVFGSQAGIYSQPFGLAADLPTPSAFVY